MSQWTWQQAVADVFLKCVRVQQRTRISLAEIYSFADELQARFPMNRHVREKIRQTLQRLRDAGFLSFAASGEYELNLAFDELQFEPNDGLTEGIETPQWRTTIRSVRLRNTFLAREMKRRYSNSCQICADAVMLTIGTYAESHHLRPLGVPHLGPDSEGNILVLCPNHHVMFDRGAIGFEGEGLRIFHVRHAFPARDLICQPWHRLNERCIRYYMETIFRACV